MVTKYETEIYERNRCKLRGLQDLPLAPTEPPREIIGCTLITNPKYVREPLSGYWGRKFNWCLSKLAKVLP